VPAKTFCMIMALRSFLVVLVGLVTITCIFGTFLNDLLFMCSAVCWDIDKLTCFHCNSCMNHLFVLGMGLGKFVVA
jgi:hypothetical protein